MTSTEALVRAPAPAKAQQRRNAALITLALLGVFVALLTLVRSSLDDPPQKGPSGSSFATTAGGVGALADLAREAGINVVRLTNDPSEDPSVLTNRDTIVVLGADLDEHDADEILFKVGTGARLVTDVGRGNTWLTDRTPRLQWDASVIGDATVRAKVSPDERTAATTLATVGLGTFSIRDEPAVVQPFGSTRIDASDHTTVATVGRRSIAERFSLGSGEIVALADSSMLSNQLLAQGDNAAFALHLLGDKPNVVFVETIHGYTDKQLSPTGLPWRARWFLAGLLFATAVLMWSRSRRLGPPEPIERELAAPRSDFLAALAAGIDAADGSRRGRANSSTASNSTANASNNSTANTANNNSNTSTSSATGIE